MTSLCVRAVFCYVTASPSAVEAEGEAELTLSPEGGAGSLLVGGEPAESATLFLKRDRGADGACVALCDLSWRPTPGGRLPFTLRHGTEGRKLAGDVTQADGGAFVLCLDGAGGPAAGGAGDGDTLSAPPPVAPQVNLELVFFASVCNRPVCLSAFGELSSPCPQPSLGRAISSRASQPSALEAIPENQKCNLPADCPVLSPHRGAAAAAGGRSVGGPSPLSGGAACGSPLGAVSSSPACTPPSSSALALVGPPSRANEWDPLAWDALGGAGFGATETEAFCTELAVGAAEDISWFSAGVRVGVGMGLGVCLGLGLGVGVLINSWRRTTQRFRGALRWKDAEP